EKLDNEPTTASGSSTANELKLAKRFLTLTPLLLNRPLSEPLILPSNCRMTLTMVSPLWFFICERRSEPILSSFEFLPEWEWFVEDALATLGIMAPPSNVSTNEKVVSFARMSEEVLVLVEVTFFISKIKVQLCCAHCAGTNPFAESVPNDISRSSSLRCKY